MKPIMSKALLAGLALALAAGCTPAEPAPPAEPAGTSATETGILVRSSPAAGTTVQAPLETLELWFEPEARLGEVTVSGPDGMMPMMVTAVGEVGHYSLPITATAPGQYTVAWSATADGRAYQGSFGFILR